MEAIHVWKRIALLLAVCCALFASGCGKDTKPKLVMGTEAFFPPYEYYSDDRIIGIDPEIVSMIARETGRELVIEDVGFDYLLEALQSGKIDIAASGITMTEERKQKVDFSEPYAVAGLVIVVPVQSAIRKPADLKGKIIGVQRSSTSDQYVTEKFGIPSRFSNVGVAAENLLDGKVDAVVMDSGPADAIARENRDLMVLKHYLVREKYAFAVRKGQKKLLAEINTVLHRIRNNGHLQKIREKHEQLYLASHQKEKTEKECLRVAVDPTFPPFGYVKDGRPEGVEPDLLRRIAAELKMDIRFEQVGFESMFEAVANDNGVDLGAGSISISPDRAKIVNFTVPYVDMEQFVLVRKDSSVTDLEQLKGKRIGVIYCTTADKYIRSRFGPPECFSEGELLCKALENGEIDGAVLDGVPADIFITRYRKLKRLPKPILKEQYAFAVRKERKELLDRINRIMNRMIADGTVQEIREKHLRLFREE